MKTSQLRMWFSAGLILTPFLVVGGAPDTTLLYDLKKKVPRDGGSASNQLALLRLRLERPVVTVLTNPPGGVGLLIGKARAGAEVKQVVTGAPAWGGGVREGDVIIGIGGQFLTGVPLQEIALRLRGQVGSEVEVTLSRPGQAQTQTVKLRRDVVSPPSHGFGL